ncbi:conjugal transfer protein TraE [Prevotella intermedia]|nr:conjugal transfer protein TraE [Prevotella intermedia]
MCSRIAMLVVACVLSITTSITTWAQSSQITQKLQQSTKAINDTTEGLKAYIEPVTKMCYALAAIVAILGAISIFNKMNNEDQDVKKSIMMVVGACVFLIAAAQALPMFFA